MIQPPGTDKTICYGWRFHGGQRNAFQPAVKHHPVTLFANVSWLEADGRHVEQPLMPPREAGRAYKVAEARQLGNAGVKAHVLKEVQAYLAGLEVAAQSDVATHQPSPAK